MFPGSWEVWTNHFEYHAQDVHGIRPEASDILTPAERRLIARSMATFQLGEQSEGRALLRAAQRTALRQRLPALPRIVELLIREEQRHAAQLKSFMEDHGIGLLRSHWTDRIFRRTRRLAGLELYLHVLLCAELIGIVYYRALEAATRCQRLKLLCRGFVADELAHVGFESELLRGLQGRRGPATRALQRRAHRLFVGIAARVVWHTHRAVLGAAGYGGAEFVQACLAQHDFHLDSPRIPAAAKPSF